MSEQVTVTLPDSLYSCATEWARRCGKTVEEVLAQSIELSLAPLGPTSPLLESWTDESILAVAAAELPPEDDRRLSELLAEQQNGTLSDCDARDLTLLMQLYQQALLRKAEAIGEAVRRGLQEPPTP